MRAEVIERLKSLVAIWDMEATEITEADKQLTNLERAIADAKDRIPPLDSPVSPEDDSFELAENVCQILGQGFLPECRSNLQSRKRMSTL